MHFEILTTTFYISLGFKQFRRWELPVFSTLIVNTLFLTHFLCRVVHSTEKIHPFIFRIVCHVPYKTNSSFLLFLADVLINLSFILMRGSTAGLTQFFKNIFIKVNNLREFAKLVWNLQNKAVKSHRPSLIKTSHVSTA